MAGKRLDNPIWSSSCLSLPSWGSATNRLVHSYWPGCSVSHPHRAQWISQSVKLQFCSWKPFSSVSSCLVVHLLHIFHGVKICLGFFFFGMTIITIRSSPQMHKIWRRLSLKSRKSQVSFTLSSYSPHTLENWIISFWSFSERN